MFALVLWGCAGTTPGGSGDGATHVGSEDTPFSEFRAEVVRATDEMGRIAASHSATNTIVDMLGYAADTDAFLEESLAWMATRRPQPCYSDAWTSWRAELEYIQQLPPLLREADSGSSDAVRKVGQLLEGGQQVVAQAEDDFAAAIETCQ